jgi:hypothetical protein
LIIKKQKAALIFLRQPAELSTENRDWHSFWTELKIPFTYKILFMKTIHPVKRFLASLFSTGKQRQYRQHGYRARLRDNLLRREESLNKIFMVRYKMGNM